MRRFLVQFDDYQLKLYGKSLEYMEQKYPDSLIKEIFDDSHKEYCEKISSAAVEVLYDHKGRQVYKVPVNSGFSLVRLYKDDEDSTWYDYIEYQLSDVSYVKPTLFTIGNPKDFYDTYMNEIKFNMIQFASHGKKLTKPKELKGLKKNFSVKFIGRTTCECYIIGNDVWIKHMDYFSPEYCRPEDVGTPLNYRLKKYGIKEKGKKFIYDDNWGAIVLRQTAWLRIDNIVNISQNMLPSKMANIICDLQKKYHKFTSDLDLEWNRFYEEIIENIRKM